MSRIRDEYDKIQILISLRLLLVVLKKDSKTVLTLLVQSNSIVQVDVRHQGTSQIDENLSGTQVLPSTINNNALTG
jgi:hypothetical protein